MTKRALLYARVSTKRQAEEGASLPTQVEHCEQYAENTGLNVIKLIQDNGYSGSKLNRPGLDEARDMIANGQVTDFVVYNSDRFTRKLHHGAILRQEFKDAGVTIHYVSKGGASDGTPESKMTQNIEDVFSEYWRDKLVEASRRGTRHKAKNGMIGMGNPGYGYRTTDKHRSGLAIYEPEAEIVRRIFDLYIGRNGRPMSLRAIAAQLTGEGVPTSGGGNRPNGRSKMIWREENIRKRIIKRSKYTGQFRYKEFEFYYPELAIIDLATWEAAQVQLQKNKHKVKRQGPAGVYPLSGRLTCKCGRLMSGTAPKSYGKTYRYYRCDAHNRFGDVRCDARMISADIVDDLAWQWLVNLFMNQERLDQELEAMAARANKDLRPIKAEMAAAQKSLEKSKAKIAKWLDTFGQEDDPDIAAMAAKRVKDEKKTKQELEQHIAALEAKIAAAEMTPEMREDVKAGIAQLIAENKLRQGATAENKKQFMEALAVKLELEEKDGCRLLHITGGTGQVKDTFALEVRSTGSRLLR